MNLSERYGEKIKRLEEVNKFTLDNVLVQIELTNICNHKCYFCPNVDSIRPKIKMDYSLAEK